MHNHRGATYCALAACLIAAGCAEDEPDPRVFARQLQREARPSWLQPAPPVVAPPVWTEVAAMPPAPLAEVRADAPAQRSVTVLVGNGAGHALGGSIDVALQGAGLTSVKNACTDRDAIEHMMQGRADFAVIAGQLSTRDQHAGLRQTQLGVELWALAVAPDSPLRSLSRSQVRKLLTGEARSFVDLGLGAGAITVYGPRDEAAARRAAKALIPGDALGDVVQPVEPRELPALLRAEGALAVVRVDSAVMEGTARLLAIDWCSPSADAFRYGTYPFGAPLTLVTSGQPAGPAAEFLAFARSPAGRTQLAGAMLVAP